MAATEGFVTPEAVVLERDLAGLGSRFIAALLDAVIQFGAIFGAAILAIGVGGDLALIIVVVVSFLALIGYPLIVEALTRGKTVGKLAARIRVVQADGRPVTVPAVLVRNLLRLVDFLPAWYAAGVVTMFVTARAQRLGDLAAGTVVVHEAPTTPPAELTLPRSEERTRAGRGIDAGGLTSEEYSLVRSFLLRRHSLDPAARAELASRLERRLRPRVGAAEQDAAPEAFLEAVAEAYRDRAGP